VLQYPCVGAPQRSVEVFLVRSSKTNRHHGGHQEKNASHEK